MKSLLFILKYVFSICMKIIKSLNNSDVCSSCLYGYKSKHGRQKLIELIQSQNQTLPVLSILVSFKEVPVQTGLTCSVLGEKSIMKQEMD